MGFKVASRVRGLSDEAFRRKPSAPSEQCRSATCPGCAGRTASSAPPAAIAGIVCWRAGASTNATGARSRHPPRRARSSTPPRAAADAVVRGRPPDRNGEERKISSVELGAVSGVKQPTAWTMKHKIMAVMARREADTPLSGRVEMDDAYLGGARAGGKRGRGAPGKTPFVAAVSTSPRAFGRPRQGQSRAGPGQGLPHARDRARRQACFAPPVLAPADMERGPHRRPALLEARSTGNGARPPKPSARSSGRAPGGGRPHGALQMGQHDARQHQERDHRNLPQARPRSCPTLPRQLRLAIHFAAVVGNRRYQLSGRGNRILRVRRHHLVQRLEARQKADERSCAIVEGLRPWQEPTGWFRELVACSLGWRRSP